MTRKRLDRDQRVPHRTWRLPARSVWPAPTTKVDAVFLPDATLAVGVTGNDAAVTVSPPGDECRTSQDGGEACYYAVTPGAP